MNIKNRLKKLENNRIMYEADIMRLIESGAYYDELTEDQKEAYCHYWDFSRESFEHVTMLLLHTLHEQLQKKFVPKSPEDERRHMKEVAEEIERLMNDKYSQIE